MRSRLYVIVIILQALIACGEKTTSDLTPGLVVSDNGRCLAAQKGDPFFWLGEEKPGNDRVLVLEGELLYPNILRIPDCNQITENSEINNVYKSTNPQTGQELCRWNNHSQAG